MKRFRFLLPTLLCLPLLPASCVTEEEFDNTPQGNFDALWTLLDQRYCFFDYKAEEYGLDWDEVRATYSPAVAATTTNTQLLEVLGNMTYELRDGHVALSSGYDVAQYKAWFEDYPMNFSDSILSIYLGTSDKYATSSGLKYKILDDNMGYLRCETFENGFGDGNLQDIMSSLALCNGLIVDVRSNSGGLLSAAALLASLFVNETTTVGYMSHKTGTGHSELSTPEAITIDPFKGLRWQKPVCVLTNRRTYSAANSFVMYLKDLDNVTLVGDKTGGGSGMPYSGELPNGWGVRFSACPMYDVNLNQTEFGIAPDHHVDISSDDYSRGVDTIIETARALLAGQ